MLAGPFRMQHVLFRAGEPLRPVAQPIVRCCAIRTADLEGHISNRNSIFALAAIATLAVAPGDAVAKYQTPYPPVANSPHTWLSGSCIKVVCLHAQCRYVRC